MSFVHLHAHNEYSLLDGAGTAAQHAGRAAELGQPALAVTNHGTLAGVIHHMDACRKAGILPIVGCEVYFRPNRRVQGVKELRYEYFHLLLLAKDARGWQNLMRVVSESHETGFYEKPCVDPPLLRQFSEGIVCGTACLGGWLCESIRRGDSTAALRWITELKSIYGDDLFLEIMPNHLEEQIAHNVEIVGLAEETSTRLCATVDAHAPYESWVLKSDDSPNSTSTHDVLLMIQTSQTLKQREKKRKEGQDYFEFKDPTYFVQSEEQVLANFAAFHPGISQRVVDQAMANTFEIAARVQPFLVSRHDKLPQIDRGRPDTQILRELSMEGLRKYGTDKDPAYLERLDFELGQIESRKQASYFLMVRDVIEWAKSDRGLPDKDGHEELGQKEPIEVGPGRGSAGGSLVSDSIGITNMDPLAYGLLFERFLNPSRKGMPDIDVDFPSDRIDEVEEYTRRKFGKEHVMDVIAHSTFGPRAAIRRVGMVLCLPFDEIDDACKSIDEQDRSPLEELRVVNGLVDHVANEHPEAFEHMCRIQGQVAGKSEHAAALIVTPPETPVREVIPVERIGGQKGKMITAWGERAGKGNAIISDYGFIKFDWLRVVELDKQVYACWLHEQRTGRKIVMGELPVHRSPYNVEPEIMKMFGQGYLAGVFQFAQTAAKLTRKLKPENIIDLAAINALIRPGPRGAGIDMKYVARKHGRQPVTYWHQNLEPFLGNTYGLMVFQEQLIEVVHHLGGLSRADADNFRKIASKLYRDPAYAREVMGEWFEPIRAGFMDHGITDEEFGYPTGGGQDGAEPTGIWGNFLSFSDYSFNLSHAAGYALLAYRDMWQKHHIPMEQYAALLWKGLSRKKEVRDMQRESAIREARMRGFDVVPPDVNDSGEGYDVTDNGFRMGLAAIKNVGPVAAREVLKHRPYESYDDFDQRVERKRCNRTAKAALVLAGAFDRFGMRNDFTEEKIDQLEREYVGVSLTSHYSLINYADVLDPRVVPEDEFDDAQDGSIVTVAGEVIGIKKVNDKNKKAMAFATIAYGPNEWSVTFFAHMWKLYRELVESARPIIVRGVKETYNGRVSVKPLQPEQQFTADGEPVMEWRADDGQQHEVWTHYVQDVDDLAQLVRSDREAKERRQNFRVLKGAA